MEFSSSEVIQYVLEEDVKFIRLAFCDVNGVSKNISIMPTELKKAFDEGIPVQIEALDPGLSGEKILLHPDPNTLAVLPWRPDHGRVVRMYCGITDEDGGPVSGDLRSNLALLTAEDKRLFNTEIDFYLFPLDEKGSRKEEPYDSAGFMDIAPLDKGENLRREVCLSLEIMGITPKSSCHSFGPGQNRICFESVGALKAADNVVTFCTVVKTIAAVLGLGADFSIEPVIGAPKSLLNISFKGQSGEEKASFKPDTNPYSAFLKLSK